MEKIFRALYNDLFSSHGKDSLIAYIIRDIPGSFGILIRRGWYGKKFKKVGKNLNIFPGTVIINPDKIECEDNIWIGYNNYIQAGGKLILKSDVMLGPYVKIWTQTHMFDNKNLPVHSQGYTFDSVEIGEDVWIGSNAFIMPGAKLGDKCIVSANSVLGSKNYPKGIIIAGHPARKIGER